MKKALLCSLVFSCLPLLADTPAAAPAPSGTAAHEAERSRALEIDDLLRNIGMNRDVSDASWDAVETKLAAYQKDFADNPRMRRNMVYLRRMELEIAQAFRTPEQYKALVKEVASDPDPAMAEVVAASKRIDELNSKPLDLKFTAVDGTAIDLTQMRGKVVLVDFWATWCPPCRGEVPNVVAAYQKYHDKGFEVVGISLDQDKDTLLKFTKANGMVWPQYFDGKAWGTPFTKSFGINEIPTMWLVDKKGMIATMNGREDLDGQVGKLLQTP